MRFGAALGRSLATLCLGMVLSVPAPGQARTDEFPQPEEMRSPVAFWKRVYLEVTTQGGLLHDSRHLGVVYETIRFEGAKGKRARQKRVDARRRHWKTVLRRLSAGKAPLTDQEETVVRLLELELGRPPKAADFRQASHRIRFQLGQRDKFREGVVRSGAYEAVMRSMFRQQGLPEDLAYLPHVESSFNVKAYSKYGAAGVWQFMRSTGRRYLKIDYIVDERLDPIVATRAAANLLKDNHEALRSWPLAITAYNHGVSGMKRAKRNLGTDDISTIIKKYRSRTFGFASRNFYAQFLAARQILKTYETYFGPIERDTPEAVDEIAMPFYADVTDLKAYLSVSPEVIRHYNPGLRPPVFRAGKRIPKGYVLRLPAGTVQPSPEKWLASLPQGKRYAEQHRSQYYKVRRGDTLSRIASRHRTSVGMLVALNNLPSKHRIYPGQTLQLPEGGKSKPKSGFSLVKTANASPKPAKKAEAKPIPKKNVQPTQGPPPPTPELAARRRLDGDIAIVEALETLGHYSEWLNVSTGRLRQLNDLSGRQALRMGQKIKLDFSRVSPETFQQRRFEYHKGVEEDFFGSFRVTGTVEHKLRRGETLWVLSHRTYRVPTWLIQRYNPELDLSALMPGANLNIPVVEPVGG